MARQSLRVILPIDEIVKRYLAGESVNSLAKHYGVQRATIGRRLAVRGIEPRGRSEAEKVKWSRMSLNQRKKQVKGAHDAVRGRCKTRDFQLRRAQGVQQKSKLSRLEKLFLYAFETAEINVIPLYALDIFNLDFAIPERKIAIEIDSGHWHQTERKLRQDKRKEAFLSEHGWKLVRLGERDLKRCVERVKALL